MAHRLLIHNVMSFTQGQGTVLESLSLKAGGEALSNAQPTVLSCGGISLPYREIPTKPLTWKEIINMPGAELSNHLFGFKAVKYEWNPYLEEAIYEN